MKNKILACLLITFMFCVRIVFAQTKIDSLKSNDLKNILRFKVGVDNGFEWEQKINKSSVIALFAGLSAGFQSDGGPDFYKAPIIFPPLFYAEYRNYFNLDHRIKENKETKNNSADFVFGGIRTFWKVNNQNFFGLFFTQGWGMQRSLSKHINADLHLGITEHFYYDKPPGGGFNYLKLEPDFQFCFSYVLN